jgi:hypothetical protein
MTQSQIILWQKIEDFQIDNSSIEFNFSERLARENGWSKIYALRVVEEYKRFIFLCCISETGVTPSDPVDQAWHLHLTYTKSYWTDLCKNTLSKEIHHNPTKGGKSEANKFDDFYTNSKNLYTEIFGSEPPKDIWHDNQTRFSDIDFQRVNLKRYWLFKKPIILKSYIISFFISVIALLFIQASSENTLFIFFGLLFGIPIIISIIRTVRNGNNSNNGDGTSGCSMAGCSNGDGHNGNSGCGSGCSGCSGSGCSGCGGGGD